MPPIKLSVVLITRNESRNVVGCLKSVAFADEWIVVDAGSSDDTAELARAFGAKVTVTPDWPGFGVQKGRALALAQGEWVFSIDADERVSDELATQIRAVIEEAGPSSPVAYEVSRLSSFCGQWIRHGDWYPDRVLRLFRRGAGRFTTDMVHERLELPSPEGAATAPLPGLLGGDLLHDTMPSLHDAIDKMNRYSTGRAVDRLKQGRSGGLFAALGHAAWAFVRCYLVRRGFMDGRLGFVLAVYVAEGTYYRYLKMAFPPAGQPA